MATPTDHTGDTSLKRKHAARNPEEGTENSHDIQRPSEDSPSNSSELSGSDQDENEREVETDGTELDSDDPEDDDAEDDYAEQEDNDHEPFRPYTNQELASFFIDFYKFLATLHYDPSDLKLPPPEGWDTSLFPSELIDKKSDLAVDLMRHLPYFSSGDPSTHLHYKSILIDYTDPSSHREAISSEKMLVEMLSYESTEDEDEPVDHGDLLVLAQGYESFGRTFILDVRNGRIIEDMIRANLLGAVDVKEFAGKMEVQFRELQLIPCSGREVKEADDVPERDGMVDEEDVRKQEEEWGTDLDWQFVRQVYRKFGWPEAFRREEAFEAMEQFMAMDEERRGEWESAFH